MDINILRSVITAISLLLFLGIVVWAWQRSRQSSFDAAAGLPFQGEHIEEPTTGAHP
ncbi:MAG: cbb3-type cytochrome oxidase subunit 3 [Rubrivivax sp.]|jgi:cytochrome c oxidase cbb3-type subunit 4|nr:cbb3-type cytochrome c oxidase subunit 3 [Rubrivivax sp.]